MKAIDALVSALRNSAQYNAGTQSAPVCVLWPDKERLWEALMPQLRRDLPELLTLGPYDVEQRSGPAIWLKCALARALDSVQFPPNRVPILYLPGVSRPDLRAIEVCPRELQPLAELQYRGVFWSQTNSRDWTLNAYLSSRNGGLGLAVAQDNATQQALTQVLSSGLLMEQAVADLQGRQINAEWLHSLLAPNPARDLLVWMNDPSAPAAFWGAARWDLFLRRCKADFGFDAISDGALVAAEKLAQGNGKWAAVAELYRDSYTSFPEIYPLLARVLPPQLDLFDDPASLAGYPRASEEREQLLRYQLLKCASLDAAQARALILQSEQEHGLRRGWLWTLMGRAPLVIALAQLAEVARGSLTLPFGAQPEALAETYAREGWQVDAAALGALASVQSKGDVEAVAAALRAVYLPWLEATAVRFQDALRAAGRLCSAAPVQVTEQGLCTVFVDGLRYDVAQQLAERLAVLGSVTVDWRWTSLPSVTASGKPWCSPVAHAVAGTKSDLEFEPRVAADGKPLSSHHFRKLLAANGVQPLEKHESGDSAGLAWIECGDLDHYGHEHGIRLARDLSSQLDQIVERMIELQQAGWKRFRVVTDHGWLLLPGGLPKSELAKHQVETRWGRCAVLKDTAHSTSLTFGWDWCSDVQVAYAPGVTCFMAGVEYTHGGLSLQECLVPVISVDVSHAAAALASIDIQLVSWKGLRCTVQIAPALPGLTLDLRTKAALESSSLASRPKPLEDGNASLAVADDEQMGVAAFLVVLDENGTIIQRAPTTVGG